MIVGNEPNGRHPSVLGNGEERTGKTGERENGQIRGVRHHGALEKTGQIQGGLEQFKGAPGGSFAPPRGNLLQRQPKTRLPLFKYKRMGNGKNGRHQSVLENGKEKTGETGERENGRIRRVGHHSALRKAGQIKGGLGQT